MYGQQLAHQISIRFSIDQAEKTKSICTILCFVFLEKLFIRDKNKAISKTKVEKSDFKLQCDRFELKNGGTGAAIVQKTDDLKKKQQKQKVCLSLNKEDIFDAEIWGISKAFQVAEQKIQQILQLQIFNIFCDSKANINNF